MSPYIIDDFTFDSCLCMTLYEIYMCRRLGGTENEQKNFYS